MIEFFESAGIGTPKVRVVTVSLPLRIDLIDSGEYVTALRRSLCRPVCAQNLAHRPAAAGLVGRDHDAEEPHLESGDRALHRT